MRWRHVPRIDYIKDNTKDICMYMYMHFVFWVHTIKEYYPFIIKVIEKSYDNPNSL